MLSFTASDPNGTPAWWAGDLQAGHDVDLEVYGDRMKGRLLDATDETLQITVPIRDQTAGLRMSTAHGTAVISLAGGAARVPVTCWSAGDLVRLQVIGPVEFVQRRVHTRLAIRLPVSLGWLRPGERTWNHARSATVDISAGGLRVAPATTVWPAVDSIVQVQLDLPDGECHLQAQVIATTPDYGLRLAFSDLAPAVGARIRQLTG